MPHPPPPPRWPWFAAIAGLALLASLTIASGRDPPEALLGMAATHSDRAASSASGASLDASPAFDRRCLICAQPLN